MSNGKCQDDCVYHFNCAVHLIMYLDWNKMPLGRNCCLKRNIDRRDIACGYVNQSAWLVINLCRSRRWDRQIRGQDVIWRTEHSNCYWLRCRILFGCREKEDSCVPVCFKTSDARWSNSNCWLGKGFSEAPNIRLINELYWLTTSCLKGEMGPWRPELIFSGRIICNFKDKVLYNIEHPGKIS